MRGVDAPTIDAAERERCVKSAPGRFCVISRIHEVPCALRGWALGEIAVDEGVEAQELAGSLSTLEGEP